MAQDPNAATQVIRAKAPGFHPQVALVLGTGIGALAEAIEGPTVIDYGELPGFPRSAVEGHAGRLVLGNLSGVSVACMQGRVHLYEGHPAADLALPIPRAPPVRLRDPLCSPTPPAASMRNFYPAA